MLGRLRTGDAPLQGKKVLVIDDDIRNVFALTSTLEQRGMKVVFAENGREGIERLHQHPNTDLVLLDIMMPEMDGYETARAIRSMPRFEHLPIISLTAKAMKGDREKAIAGGAAALAGARLRPDSARRTDARARRPGDRQDDQEPSADSRRTDRVPDRGTRRGARHHSRLWRGRGRLRAQALRSRAAALQGRGIRRARGQPPRAEAPRGI